MYANNLMQDVAIERTASITTSSSGESYPFANLKRYTIKENAEDIVTLKSKVSANEIYITRNTMTTNSLSTSVGNNAANIANNAPVMIGVLKKDSSGALSFQGTISANVSSVQNINNELVIEFNTRDASDYLEMITNVERATKAVFFESTDSLNQKTIHMYDASKNKILIQDISGKVLLYNLAVFKIKTQTI